MGRVMFDSDGRLVSADGIDVKRDKQKQERISSFEAYEKTAVRKDKLKSSKDLEFLRDYERSVLAEEAGWSLYKEEKLLAPLKFSNGKTQEDIVKEIVNKINAGAKFIYLHGVCGTGKSAIALNVARIIGKASIVVPLKNLQRQYEEDYTRKLYLYKNNGERLKIASLTGRDNHDSVYFAGESCAETFLPELIPITEKNYGKIRDYYKDNPYANSKTTPEIKDIRRMSIAPANPYWSPILPSEIRVPFSEDARKIKYIGADGREYTFYHRQPGCSYYDQYLAYGIADVIIYNSAKYLAEMRIGRKPATKIEIIDEADEFLDNLFEQESINITRTIGALKQLRPETAETRESIRVIVEKLELEERNKRALGVDSESVIPISETKLKEAFQLCIRNEEVKQEIILDENNYSNNLIESAKKFCDIMDEVYAVFRKEEDSIIVSLLSTNLKGQISELFSKSKAILCMSGTPHSMNVLKNIFGISRCEIVHAETGSIGTIEIIKTGKEIDARHSNLSRGGDARGEYLTALELSIEKAPRPTLVHVNAYADLPSEEEIVRLGVKNLISREQLRSIQENDKNGGEIALFKQGKKNVLFSTRCTRGVDFPGEMCRSVVFTKYPNPNTQDIFWKILKQQHPGSYWEYYQDKAKREFLQRIYRAIRFATDHVYVLSPDVRVLQAVRVLQEEMIKNK